MYLSVIFCPVLQISIPEIMNCVMPAPPTWTHSCPRSRNLPPHRMTPWSSTIVIGVGRQAAWIAAPL